MGKRLSDFDKNMKVRHLGGKPVTLTVQHVGVKREKVKSDVVLLTGGELPDDYEETAVLYWKEYGSRLPLLLHATNREFILKTIGDSDKWANALIGKLVTLERKVHPAFKKEYVGITKIENPPSGKPLPVNVNKETGEIVEIKSNSTAFWSRADTLGLKAQAGAIIEKNTVNGETGKTTNWAAAIAELEGFEKQPA